MIDLEKFREGAFKGDRIGYALRGENPTTLARMNSGFVFLMDYQFLPGWCVLTAVPQVYELTSLAFEARNQFLSDMHLLGEAIQAATDPLRMNYSILGNSDNYLHAHVYPRYAWEAPERLRKPAWFYAEEGAWGKAEYLISEKHIELATAIQENLKALKEKYYPK